MQDVNPAMARDVGAVTASHVFAAKTPFAATTFGTMSVQPSAKRIVGDVEPSEPRAARKQRAMDALPQIVRDVMDANVKTAYVHSTHTAAKPLGTKPVSRSAQKIVMDVVGLQEIAGTTRMDVLLPTPQDVEGANANNVSALSMTIAAPTPGTTSASTNAKVNAEDAENPQTHLALLTGAHHRRIPDASTASAKLVSATRTPSAVTIRGMKYVSLNVLIVEGAVPRFLGHRMDAHQQMGLGARDALARNVPAS